MKTDAVYVFRRSDSEYDVELMYSLRSVKKNLGDVGTIWIVGDLPAFSEDACVDFKHIPANDPFPITQKNVRSKLLKAISTSEISDHFVVMNDDFYFLAPSMGYEIPYFRQGTLQQHIEWREGQEGSHYVRALQETLTQLQKQNYPTTDFECHTPFVVLKPELGDILENFDWDATYGLVWRSLYGNRARIRGTRHMDLKIDSPLSDKELDRCFCACPFLSTGKGGLNDAMIRHLRAAFPAG